MSMAAQYMMSRKKKMAKGGACEAHGTEMCEMCHGGEMATGGTVGVHDRSPASSRVGTETSVAGDYTRRGVTRQASNKGRIAQREGAADQKIAKDIHRDKLSQLQSMRDNDRTNLAEGGVVEDDDRFHETEYAHPVENQSDVEDMVGRIVKKHLEHYSKGGEVANDTPIKAGFEPDQFDDLVKDDSLEEHYTGENSGDETGDHKEMDEDHDLVSRIMKSRRLKDRMPRPA